LSSRKLLLFTQDLIHVRNNFQRIYNRFIGILSNGAREYVVCSTYARSRAFTWLDTGFGDSIIRSYLRFDYAFGVGLISDFISKEQYTIQLIGSIVLIIFGFIVFRTHPLKGWSPQIQHEETRYIKDFVSSFLLTFSNVTIIFVFYFVICPFQL